VNLTVPKGPTMAAFADIPVHLVDEVKEKLLRPGFTPPMLPAVALDVLRLSRTPHVTLEQIEAVLRGDPALAGRVLQQAQSPLFGTQQITSLRDGLVRLGLRKVGDLVLWTAMNGTVFKGGHTASVEALRKHSAATAYASSIVAKYTPNPPDFAFLCGLLHDVGAVVLLTHRRDHDEMPDDVFWNMIDHGHAEVGASVAIAWHLPNEVETVISSHHCVFVNGYPHPLSAIVCLGEDLATQCGYGWPDHHSDKSPENVLQRAKTALRLTEHQFKCIQEEVEENVAASLG
jgi:putative nucleotidyltransferase with HDIG domain